LIFRNLFGWLEEFWRVWNFRHRATAKLEIATSAVYFPAMMQEPFARSAGSHGMKINNRHSGRSIACNPVS
jgi:hypothetical protein